MIDAGNLVLEWELVFKEPETPEEELFCPTCGRDEHGYLSIDWEEKV